MEEVEMRGKWWLLLLLVGALALGLAACSSNEGTEPAASPSEEVAEAAEATTPATAPAEELLEEVEAEPGAVQPAESTDLEGAPRPEEAFSRAQLALEGLESYRYTTTFLFVGEEAGEPETGSIELTGIVAGPDEMHLTWRDLETGEAFEVIQIGSEAWILTKGEWEEAPVAVSQAMSQAALVYAPSVAWGGLFGELEPDALYVGREDVDGISTEHFSATYTQWGSYWRGELVDASGDVWIAEAGYPVKYAFTATGVNEEGDTGSVTWTMELSDVNETIVIEPPV
jgi:hypothetical protein